MMQWGRQAAIWFAYSLCSVAGARMGEVVSNRLHNALFPHTPEADPIDAETMLLCGICGKPLRRRGARISCRSCA